MVWTLCIWINRKTRFLNSKKYHQVTIPRTEWYLLKIFNKYFYYYEIEFKKNCKAMKNRTLLNKHFEKLNSYLQNSFWDLSIMLAHPNSLSWNEDVDLSLKSFQCLQPITDTWHVCTRGAEPRPQHQARAKADATQTRGQKSYQRAHANADRGHA